MYTVSKKTKPKCCCHTLNKREGEGEGERERENFICHSNEQEYHTAVTIQQNISTHVWQAARKGITPIELATLKRKKKRTNLTSL